MSKELFDIKEQVAEHSEMLRQLSFDLQRLREHEQSEREKFMLVENALLRFERLLPPSAPSKPRKR
jgi:hypothetical protein